MAEVTNSTQFSVFLVNKPGILARSPALWPTKKSTSSR